MPVPMRTLCKIENPVEVTFGRESDSFCVLISHACISQRVEMCISDEEKSNLPAVDDAVSYVISRNKTLLTSCPCSTQGAKQHGL